MKFDIGIPSAPVLRDSFFLPTRLMSIHLFRDSLYLIHIDNSTFDGVLSMLYANTTQHLTAARTVQGFYLPGQDAFTFGGDKFLVFLPNYVYIWRLPVTDGNSPAYTFTVGDNSRFFCVKNGFGFSTIDSGVQVLDMRNLNTVTPIDTIRCGFNPTDMDVYKNLLIVCSNVRNHLYIYDVDTISAIAEVAHYNGVVSQATVDSARAYLFAAAGAPSLVAFNIAGLVQEPPNTPPAFAGATDSITVTENTTATWKARATDADNDPVTFTFENLPAWATRTSDSTLSLSPVHASASVFIRVIAADNRGGRDTLTLHVLVDHPIGITARQRPVARPRTAGALLVGLDGRIATSRNARTPHGVYFMKTTDGSSVARIVVPGR